MPSDIEIAQAAKMQRIAAVAREKLGIGEEHLEPYGHYKAKVSLKYLETLKSKKNGKLVLVTAISPTPAGEGKTTTTVGLGDFDVRRHCFLPKIGLIVRRGCETAPRARLWLAKFCFVKVLAIGA